MLRRHNRNQLEFLDLISLMSFCISLMNLNENITQNDLQQVQQEQSKDIHEHLRIQDEKIDYIISILENSK